MGKDENELVPMNKEPGYGGTDAEEKIDISVYFQYTQMFSPPFIVELLLWPLQTIEYGLLYAVASTSAPAAA